MNRLLFSFFKRLIIVPLVVAVLLTACVHIAMPKLVEMSNKTATFSSNVDVSSFNIKEYSSLAELNAGDYVATIESDDVEVSCAVCYDLTNEGNSAGIVTASTEPWKDGRVAIVGEKGSATFKNFHNATAGTEVKIDYYKNAKCTYKVNGVMYNKSFADVQKMAKNNDLIICVPYMDFENEDESLYIVYVAELGGVEEWN